MLEVHRLRRANRVVGRPADAIAGRDLLLQMLRALLVELDITEGGLHHHAAGDAHRLLSRTRVIDQCIEHGVQDRHHVRGGLVRSLVLDEIGGLFVDGHAALRLALLLELWPAAPPPAAAWGCGWCW